MLAYEFVCLANERLGQFETQDRCIKPIEIRALVLGVFYQNLQQLIFSSFLVTKYELFFCLIQDKLSRLLSHCYLQSEPTQNWPAKLTGHVFRTNTYILYRPKSRSLKSKTLISLNNAIKSTPWQMPHGFYRPIRALSLQIDEECWQIKGKFSQIC
jgi:hypothetical protein